MKRLYIPRGVVKGKQWLEGYGQKEALQSLFLLLWILPFWLIFAWLTGFNYLAVISFIGLILFSTSMTVKVEQVSAYDMAMRIIRFLKSQKKYKYKGYLSNKE